ncbi:flagellar biosynthetic protein FliO [Novosphingobium panipatense]|uniref:Flagellar biogenesis protein FliO n=1 Tax=Novosphingobium panipatense TaxID=428991 RepID=A0ABY1QPB2_9SPHN|nr:MULTISPECIES: flagellar biosynthetic protein FliO [Novosphingobium]SMP76239.1 Flagellar biogenesis protein FliO [Novosphingobium panipatense]
MDALSLLRMLGALLLVLGLLAAALWTVRRYDLTLPQAWLGRLAGPASDKRLHVVERLAIDQKRSLLLVRRDETEFSLVIGPEGVTVLETGMKVKRIGDAAAPHPVETPQPQSRPAPLPEPPNSFAERIPVLPEVWFTQDGNMADLSRSTRAGPDFH